MQALPEDLKTKLSIDDELVSSPKEALSRVSADKRNKHLKRFLHVISAQNLFFCEMLYFVETMETESSSLMLPCGFCAVVYLIHIQLMEIKIL